MSTIANPLSATPIPARPTLVTPPSSGKPTQPKWHKWVLPAAAVLVITSGAWLWRAHVQSVVLYDTVPIELGSIQATVTATGNLNAVKDVLVSSQVSGNIKALYADWNTRVKQGQLVALIDPEIFQAQVDQATAAVRSARSATITAEAQLEKAKSDLSSMIANEKSAEAVSAKDVANAVNAKAQWERAEELFKEEVISAQDRDTAKAAYDAGQAQVVADKSQVDAAKQAIQSGEAQVTVAQSQLASARALESQAQAALRQANINLIHTRIEAPVDGTVVARRMDVGQTVASSLNPPTIFEIAQDLTKMQVDTNVDESDVGNIAVNQVATFTVDSYPDATFHGRVDDIRKAPIVTQNVVTYDVVITVENSDLKLFPGMTANVTILTARLADTLKVPNGVLRFHPSSALLKQMALPTAPAGKQQLYVLEKGKLAAVPVVLGLSDGKYTAVKGAGLRAGQQAVLRATLGQASSTSSPSRPMPGGPRV
ncbi:MAG TPA: efflux RND transporter periplasmic adaptor subunit [Candidatus Methylomirabilis sp.]|nr:efflux RND transporter periplasmic adaptor subunit [Candidatus Methylomirabilis sp.]